MKHMFYLMALFLLSCSGGDSGEQQDGKLNISDSWIAVVINNKVLEVYDNGVTSPSLEISDEEMRYTGSDGCNNYNGGIMELDKKTIRFGLAAGTRMICLDMEIPDLFNRTLAEVTTWEIKKEKLHLFDVDGNELMQLKKSD